MVKYPKPDGWNGGPDGKIMRQGTGGRIGVNPADDDIDPTLAADFRFRANEQDFNTSHLGCSSDNYTGDADPLGDFS